MKLFRLTAAVLLLIPTTGISSLSGETFYLAEQARVGGDVRVSDLLLVPAAHDLYSEALPVETEGRFVYLSQKGISGIVPGGLTGALIGSGIWLIPEGYSSVENVLLFPFLRKIESLIREENGGGWRGFYIPEADVAALFRAPGLHRIRRGTELFLETRDPQLKPVPVIFLENLEQESRRVPAGTHITLYISRKGLIIEAEARTNRGAQVGERVPVTLKHTRRRLEALLTGSGEGEVRF